MVKVERLMLSKVDVDVVKGRHQRLIDLTNFVVRDTPVFDGRICRLGSHMYMNGGK